ncbi:hypothetical protein B0H13DRAFT_1898378 [Mycena leptocephala]|nr:hypothetical protein B0H13DRAFT_1898378 [Mycena leptocephala]
MHQESKVVQRDYRDTDGDLIAPHEHYEKLTEGTLFSAQITLHTNIFNGKSGYPRKRSLFFYHCIQMYHINVDRLLIHDKGYGEPSAPDVPFMPSSGTATPRSVRVLSGMAMLILRSTLSMPSRPPKKLGKARDQLSPPDSRLNPSI